MKCKSCIHDEHCDIQNDPIAGSDSPLCIANFKKPTAYISGHLDLTTKEYNEHYHSKILDAVIAGHDFVVGDARGADWFAQCQLQIVALPGISNVVVYHMGSSPRNNCGFTLIGGYASDSARDEAMTDASTYDIAWVRPGREKSGTAKNIRRRASNEN